MRDERDDIRDAQALDETYFDEGGRPTSQAAAAYVVESVVDMSGREITATKRTIREALPVR